jgi:uncharacterized membrane protein YbhN (UPF0104 family)
MRARRWQIAFSVLLTIGVVILAYVKRDRITTALVLMREARPLWLLLAAALELLGFFCASQVYQRVLRSLGYSFGPLRLWATALVAIVLSQSVPGGGVASYAFLVQTFRRRSVPPGHSTLVASLEAMSYAGAMVLLFGFSLSYLIFHSGLGAAEDSGAGLIAANAAIRAGLIAASVAILVIGGAAFVLTRDEAVLTRWLLALKNGAARLVRRQWSDAPVHKLVDELARGRVLIMARPGELALLVLIQLVALTIHSLAMLVVLYSLGVTTSLFAVMTAFGIALITSTFNVLPGGGGTVEAVLVLSLTQLGVGDQAYIAAVIFRLLNFWLLMPIAAICYRWLMHGAGPGAPGRQESQQPLAHD